MHDFQTYENISTRRMGPICDGRWDIRLGTLPVVTAFFTSLTFIITYIISVYDGHVYPYFPTISNTGGRKPESNIFSVLLSVSSFLMFLVMWVRYIQYKHDSDYNETEHGKLLFANKLSFGIGIVACIGALVVAGFQDRGKSTDEHYIGAVAVFGGGAIYGCIQSYMTYGMVRCGMNTRRLFFFRIFISIVAVLCLLNFFIMFDLSYRKYENKKDCDYEHWRPEDPGYVLHIIASVSEWLCAIVLLVFFLSFVNEFNKIQISFVVSRHHNLNILPFQTSTEEHQPLPYA